MLDGSLAGLCAHTAVAPVASSSTTASVFFIAYSNHWSYFFFPTACSQERSCAKEQPALRRLNENDGQRLRREQPLGSRLNHASILARVLSGECRHPEPAGSANVLWMRVRRAWGLRTELFACPRYWSRRRSTLRRRTQALPRSLSCCAPMNSS
jgi:hypothetical protein